MDAKTFWYIGAGIAGGAVLIALLKPKNQVVVLGGTPQDTASIAQMLAQISVAGTQAAASQNATLLKDTLAITADTAKAANDTLQGVALASMQSLVASKGLDVEERVQAMGTIANLAGKAMDTQVTASANILAANTAITQTAFEHATALDLAKLQASLDLASFATQYRIAELQAGVTKEQIASQERLGTAQIASQERLGTAQIASGERIASAQIEAGREAVAQSTAIQSQALEGDFMARLLSMLAGVPYVPGDYGTLYAQSGQIMNSIGNALVAANVANQALASQNFQVSEALKTERQGQQLGFISDLVGAVVKGLSSAIGGSGGR
jgi:hypothetical protein